MNTPHPHSIETWLDALRGRDETRETAELRRLFKHNAMPVPELDPDKRAIFIKNLRQQGGFKTGSAKTSIMSRIRRMFAQANGHGLALAASVTVLGIGLSLTWQLGVERKADWPDEYLEQGIVMRGGEQGIRIVVQDPRALANKISDVLARYQLPMRRLEQGDLIQIQAKVPAGHAARSELLGLGVSTPSHGRLSLILTAQNSRISH